MVSSICGLGYKVSQRVTAVEHNILYPENKSANEDACQLSEWLKNKF